MSKQEFSKSELEYIKVNYRDKTADEILEKLKTKDKEMLLSEIERLEKKAPSAKSSENNASSSSFASMLDSLDTDIVPYFTKKFDYIIAAILSVISLGLYTYTLTPSLSAGDNGELTTAIYFLGIGHAPGYPIYTTLAKLFTYLPINNVAWRTNFFSAFMGAVTIFITYIILVKLLGHNRKSIGFNPKIHLPAILGTLAFALSDNLWSQSVMAEVYTLNIAQTAVLILITILWYEDLWKHRLDIKPYYGVRYMIAFAFLFGVALGDHPIILPFGMLPIAAFGIVSLLANRKRRVTTIEIPLISIAVFLFAVAVAGMGYLRLIMAHRSNLMFVYNIPGLPDAVTIGEYIKVMATSNRMLLLPIAPENISLGSFFNIVTAHFRVDGLMGDLLTILGDPSVLLTPFNERQVLLRHPFYPNLYHGIFIVFWPVFIAITWYAIYTFFLKKKTEKIRFEDDVISDVTMKYYIMLFAFVLGFMVHLYMPIRARAMPPLNCGQMNEPGATWENFSYFFNMFHRKQYPKNETSLFMSSGQMAFIAVTHLKQLALWAKSNILRVFGILTLLALVIPGLFNQFKKSKILGGFTLGGWLVFVIALMAYMNPGTSAREAFFNEVFFLPAVFYMIVMVAFGFQFYMEYFGEKLKIKNVLKPESFDDWKQSDEDAKLPILARIKRTDYLWAVVFLLFVTLVIGRVNFIDNNNHNNWSNHDYCYNLMMSLEPNAILATEGGDNQVFGLAYYTMVEHRRSDLKIYDQKGNVFERIYGNLMRMDGRWLDRIRDNVDGMFIETGRPYYMLWRRPGLENIGDYYFRPYGIVYKVQPIKYRFIDELEIYEELSVSRLASVAQSELNRVLSSEKMAEYLHALIDEGLINLPKKNIYDGSEIAVFKKMYEPPIENLPTEESYWDMYEKYSHPIPIKEAQKWDWLTREIHISYQMLRLDMLDRLTFRHTQKADVARRKGRNEEASMHLAKVESLKEERKKTLHLAEEYAEGMGNYYFVIAGQYASLGMTDEAIDLYEQAIEEEPYLYQALLNLGRVYEAKARDAKSTYEDEETNLIKAKEYYIKAKILFEKISGGRRENYGNDQAYRQIVYFVEQVENAIGTPRKIRDEYLKQAQEEGSVEAYLRLANVYIQRRELNAAEEVYKSLIDRNDISKARKEELHRGLADMYMFTFGRFADARDIYSQYTNTEDTTSAVMAFRIAETLQYEQKYREAAKAYDVFIEKASNYESTDTGIAQMLSQARNINSQIYAAISNGQI